MKRLFLDIAIVVGIVVGLGVMGYLLYLLATLPTSDPWADRFKAKCDSMYGVTYGDSNSLECFQNGNVVFSEKR